MPAMQSVGNDVETISRDAFRKLCDEIYRDRLEIYRFNPALSRREALLWMLLGCLISLLSVKEEELQLLADPSSLDPYADAVRRLLRERGAPPFDPLPYLLEMSKRLEDK